MCVHVCVRQRQGKQAELCPPWLWFIGSELYWYSLFMPQSSHCFPLTWALHKSRCDRQAAPLWRLVRRGGLPWAAAPAPTHHHDQMCSAVCYISRVETTNASKHAQIFTYPDWSFLLPAGCGFNWNITTDILDSAEAMNLHSFLFKALSNFSVEVRVFTGSVVYRVCCASLLLGLQTTNNPSFTPQVNKSQIQLFPSTGHVFGLWEEAGLRCQSMGHSFD